MMAKFKFHGVGQGLFYSGILNNNHNNMKNFSFVYDCGSVFGKSKEVLEREIDVFYKEHLHFFNNKPKLDFLVISHFHDDHINGISYLLSKFDVDLVIMPYMCQSLKQLSLWESKNNFLEHKFEIELNEDIFINTEKWLFDNGVSHIVQLGYYEQEHENVDDINKNLDTINLDNLVVEGKFVGHKSIGNNLVYYFENEFSFKAKNYDWVFNFENLKADINKIKEFGEKTSTIDIAAESSIKEIQKVTKEVFGEGGKAINRTSVVMEHFPLKLTRIVNCELVSKDFLLGHREYYPYSGPLLSKTILTGDVEMNKTDELIILKNNKNNPYILQYPHHGSSSNIMENFTCGVDKLNVISFGLGNQFRHPNYECVDNLNNVILVNQKCGFRYTIDRYRF